METTELDIQLGPVVIASVFAYFVYAYWTTDYSACRNTLRATRMAGATCEGPFRHMDSLRALVATSYGGKRTIDQVFEAAVREHCAKRCLGTRELLSEEDMVQANGKVMKKAVYGRYKWQNYRQVAKRVDAVGSGLEALGVQPRMKVAIFLETRAEWFIACHACFRNNYVVVTVYATLNEQAITHALNETQVTHVVTSTTLLTTRLRSCVESLPALQHIILVQNSELVLCQLALPESLTVTTFSELSALGSANPCSLTRRQPPTPDDLAIIMYTSGQSGEPKGVLISHSNFVAGMTGISGRIPDLGPCDVYIGYLPLAHVLELAAENIIIAAGGCVGYSSPFTLTDKSPRIKPGTKGDASQLKPTLMACVPEIMERMRKTVNQQVEDSSYLKRALFQAAFNYKQKHVERGQDTPLVNSLVFKKTRAIIGGRVRALLSGGAPLNARTQAFMNVCMCCPVVQGYGLTETCGATTITEITHDFSYGRTGPPLQCCQIKLVAWAEGGYAPTQIPPRGEIHVGGPNISMGYYNNPCKTAEDFYLDHTGERWFRTGDIGQLDYDGCLRVVDRKKDLVKLSRGEYLALGNIEAKLKSSALIDNIWVYANSQHDHCVAVVVPNEAAVRSAIESNGVYTETLYRSDAVLKLLKKAINDAAASTDMARYEIPQQFIIEAKPWLPEDGLITAAFKLKRKALENYYAAEITQLYAVCNG